MDRHIMLNANLKFRKHFGYLVRCTAASPISPILFFPSKIQSFFNQHLDFVLIRLDFPCLSHHLLHFLYLWADVLSNVAVRAVESISSMDGEKASARAPLILICNRFCAVWTRTFRVVLLLMEYYSTFIYNSILTSAVVASTKAIDSEHHHHSISDLQKNNNWTFPALIWFRFKNKIINSFWMTNWKVRLPHPSHVMLARVTIGRTPAASPTHPPKITTLLVEPQRQDCVSKKSKKCQMWSMLAKFESIVSSRARFNVIHACNSFAQTQRSICAW